MNFYLQNKHLFEDDHNEPPSDTRIGKLEQYLSKSRPPQPVLRFQSEREPLSQPDPPKTVFSQNARNLLGNNYNDKYEVPSYDRNSYAGKRDAENRPTDKSVPYGQPNSDSMKAIISPLKVNYSQEAPSVNSLKDVDRYNPLSNYDGNARVGTISSIPKPRSRTQNPQEDRLSYKESVSENPYGYGGILGKNLNMAPNDPFKRPEPLGLQPENRMGMWQNNNLSRPEPIPLRQNIASLSQEWPANRQSDSHRDRDRYNPQKGNSGQQSVDSRNYLSNEDSYNDNKYPLLKANQPGLPPTNRMSHNETRGISQRTKETSSMKVTSVDPTNEEKRHSRFPHDDYQALKRKLGIKIDSGTSDNNPFQASKPQFLPNWQSRLSQLNSIRNRRTLPEALERRLLTSLIPDRKEQLKAVLKKS